MENALRYTAQAQEKKAQAKDKGAKSKRGRMTGIVRIVRLRRTQQTCGVTNTLNFARRVAEVGLTIAAIQVWGCTVGNRVKPAFATESARSVGTSTARTGTLTLRNGNLANHAGGLKTSTHLFGSAFAIILKKTGMRNGTRNWRRT